MGTTFFLSIQVILRYDTIFLYSKGGAVRVYCHILMIINQKITPSGTKDILFEETAKLREVQAKLNNFYLDQGYKEVMTPSLEYMSLFSDSQSFIPSEEMYKTTDNKGNVLAVRPDNTIPIARLVSTKLGSSDDPIRLFYNQRTFKMNAKDSGRSDEIIQSGVELIGSEGEEGDFEILSLAFQTLKMLKGKQSGRFEIGYVGFFDALCQSLEISGSTKESLRILISEKKNTELEETLSTLPESKEKSALLALPRLFGGEEVIKAAELTFAGTAAESHIVYFKKVYNYLNEISEGVRIIIDLGELGKMHYYTGIFFSCFIQAIGEDVIRGGRYDSLYSMFGQNRKAIGFGVNVDLARQVNTEEKTKGPLRIALTKGRIEKVAVGLFKEMGLDTTDLENKGRKLILPVGEDLEIILAKSADVITYVETGVCHLGVVGQDTILEANGDCYQLLDLGIGKCDFCVAAIKGEYNKSNVKTVASKYPRVTREYFKKEGLDIDVIKIEGSVELAPLLGLSDAIVDLVETGTTLKENNLEVTETICSISTRLIVNKASLKMRKPQIDQFTDSLAKCL